MQPERPIVKKGQFYFIYEGNDRNLILADKTKRGLEIRENTIDDKYNVEAEKGIIYDINGTGHRVGIRWYFPKAKYSLQDVIKLAEEMENKYKAIQEMTCPEDGQ